MSEVTSYPTAQSSELASIDPEVARDLIGLRAEAAKTVGRASEAQDVDQVVARPQEVVASRHVSPARDEFEIRHHAFKPPRKSLHFSRDVALKKLLMLLLVVVDDLVHCVAGLNAHRAYLQQAV